VKKVRNILFVMAPIAEVGKNLLFIKQKKREIAYLDASLNFHEHKEFEKIQPLFSRIIHISDQAFATQIFTQTCLVPKLEEKAIRFIIKKHETFCFEIHKLLFQMITPWILNALIVSSLFDKLIVDSSFIFEEPTRFYTVLTLQVFSWASFIWTLFQFIKLYNKPLCTSKKTVTPTFCYSSKLLEPLKIEMEQALQSRLSSFYEALRLPLDKTPLEPRSRSASPLFDLYLDELPDPEALSIEDLEHELHKKAQSLAQKLERSFYANLS